MCGHFVLKAKILPLKTKLSDKRHNLRVVNIRLILNSHYRCRLTDNCCSALNYFHPSTFKNKVAIKCIFKIVLFYYGVLPLTCKSLLDTLFPHFTKVKQNSTLLYNTKSTNSFLYLTQINLINFILCWTEIRLKLHSRRIFIEIKGGICRIFAAPISGWAGGSIETFPLNPIDSMFVCLRRNNGGSLGSQ